MQYVICRIGTDQCIIKYFIKKQTYTTHTSFTTFYLASIAEMERPLNEMLFDGLVLCDCFSHALLPVQNAGLAGSCKIAVSFPSMETRLIIVGRSRAFSSTHKRPS